MTPGRSLSAKTTARSWAPAATTTERARIRRDYILDRMDREGLGFDEVLAEERRDHRRHRVGHQHEAVDRPRAQRDAQRGVVDVEAVDDDPAPCVLVVERRADHAPAAQVAERQARRGMEDKAMGCGHGGTPSGQEPRGEVTRVGGQESVPVGKKPS